MKHSFTLLALSGVLLASAASAAFSVQDYEEASPKDRNAGVYGSYRKKLDKTDSQSMLLGTLKANFKRFNDRYRVPGAMSATELAPIARIVGPANSTASLRIGDTIYFQWTGSPGPREGDRYMTYTPAIVMQSTSDPTDFQIRGRPKSLKSIPDEFRIAGYFYEASGTVRILRVNQGTVEAVIERLSNVVTIGDELMPVLPVEQDLKPIVGGIQLAAAVVAGSPVDRLSTLQRSFIYINRGRRDGIVKGQLFQAVESVRMEGSTSSVGPERSVGEAMVVYVSDSYSTAVITKQFDVIRIGSLLKTKQENSNIHDFAPYKDLVQQKSANDSGLATPEVPDIGDMSAHQDPSLPNPGKAPAPSDARVDQANDSPESPLSDLDSMEKNLKANQLTPEERARLGTLSKQEKLDLAPKADEEETGDDIPKNSFGKPKADAKKNAKKVVKPKNDEEELNLLMQQN